MSRACARQIAQQVEKPLNGLALYERLANKTYVVANKATAFDFDHKLMRPNRSFAMIHGSRHTAEAHLGGLGIWAICKAERQEQLGSKTGGDF